uniref:Ribosome assembly factor mrt4 n=1 Tax=Bicosoecida sp. CB-2014 TaxID=1486930 RepID=A0A7S1CDL9_9STRA|mmetsp:Transcript_23072/g.80435  ORF Transcript_23072/g.80435 Transcript_23072/m.80435 type:complete len:234 (+) Transcript_23072:46-747(+)|eukprot:CAMPEP_0203809902 /NCGR_PEP_ID=MMETSP0115-20131106/2603_1 /ASSEMBLY_ACC=CAM_ASM_000227 /TAXON_ID=33651 /ORGANISM="Bicosoecid sp, Strain ms1" /LENGTH=233 /DNA_ID=CAMNT_0050718667 /DNA_START=24 /DNA_END=725 /DNA_ORIENTATION=-
MPKSKRAKVVSLTKTEAAPQERKASLIERIRDSIDAYSRIYVFSFENMRTQSFKELRVEWADSRFFLGKNKVMRVALGRDEEEEYRDGLAGLGKLLTGNVGLLFTNRSPEDVAAFFDEYGFLDFARGGFEATEDVELEAGPLEGMQHTMVEQLTKLGLPVVLDRGVVTLTKRHDVCKAGDVLTPEQARLLKLFDRRMSEFKIVPVAMWHADEVTMLADGAVGGAGGHVGRSRK